MPGELLDAARRYLARGYAVVPVRHAEKFPTVSGWESLRLTDADLPRYFNGAGNIGVLLGGPSGWLVDVDLDCDEAVALAPEFLPPTGAKSGRPGKPDSHWWYVCEGAKTRQHRDRARKMIVELRSTGAQTVVGPSVHPSGERYDPLDGEPARIDAEGLGAAVAALARAVVALRGGGPTPEPSTPPHRPARHVPSDDAVLRRAAAYLDGIPPAVSGAGGHAQTYAAATAMVHGFGIDPDAAFDLLATRYNPRCQPPWSDKELRHKVADAAGKAHARPYGWLRDAAGPDDDGGVDLSGLLGPPTPTTPQAGDKRHGGGAIEAAGSGRPGDPGPFPPGFLDVPGFIGRVMEHNLATATRPQPVLALASAVCLQAVLAARKVRDERGNRTNVYCVGVAPSGAGKDHARKVTKNILFSADMLEHEGSEDLASDAGLIAAVEAEPAVLFQIDEFGRFLRTIGDPKKNPHLFNVLSALMKLYSSADTIFRGKAYADRKKNKVVDQPCVSLYGTTTPEHFFGALTADSLSDGFLARMMVFESESIPDRRWSSSEPVPRDVIESAAWWGAFRPGGNLAGEHPTPMTVEATPEARGEFGSLAAVVDRSLAGPGGPLWARAEEKACRLALVYACSADARRPLIDAAAARWACGLSEYLTRRMLTLAHDWVADGLFDARQKRVLRVVREAGGTVTRSALCRRTQWLTQRERQEVIDNLLETGALAVERGAGRQAVYSVPGAGAEGGE